jgi:hypothetical protein
MTPRRDRDHI